MSATMPSTRPSTSRASGPTSQTGSAALRDGRGFVLVRGFPVDELSPRQTELAYVGLGLQMGTPVSQNAAGDLFGSRARRGRRAHRPQRAALPDEAAPGLPHRRSRHRRLALPPDREPSGVRAASPARPLSTTGSWPSGPTSSRCSTSRCAGIATAKNGWGRIPTSRCRSSPTSAACPGSSSSAGTSGTPNGTPACPASRSSRPRRSSSSSASPTTSPSSSRWSSGPATSNGWPTTASCTAESPTRTTPIHGGGGTCSGSGWWRGPSPTSTTCLQGGIPPKDGGNPEPRELT